MKVAEKYNPNKFTNLDYVFLLPSYIVRKTVSRRNSFNYDLKSWHDEKRETDQRKEKELQIVY